MTQAATAPEGTAGSTPAAPVSGTPAAAAPAPEGQATAAPGSGTSQAAPAAPAEETFFDPKAVPDELKPAYNQMRNAFTKKMQTLSQSKEKISAYDAFLADPVASMQRFAQQYGYSLTRAEATAAVNAQGTQSMEDWQPKTWGEVMQRMEQTVMDKVRQQLDPVFKGVQKVTAHNIEQQLSQIDENWQLYEDDMKSNIAAHPTLVNDVAKLYRMSVPEDVLTSRAVQTALKKLEDKAKGAQVHGSSNAPRSTPAPKAAKNFQEAVEIAKGQIAAAGR
jgi:hypothetical protein